MNILSKYLAIKYLYPVFYLLLILFFYSLLGRIPDIDDAWIGENAYWLAKDGYVHSELMRGINHQEILNVVHHKLFTLNGALFIKLFGFSLYTLKAVSLLYFLVFIVLFYFYAVRWQKLFAKDDMLFSLILIIAFPWIFKYSFLYRPEIMMMTFGFAGYILLEEYLDSQGNKRWPLFLSGIFFGLTMATHLNGLIFIVSAFFLILWNKRFFALPVFVLGALLGFMVYFYDYTGLSYFELWRQQFFGSPALDSLAGGPAWLKPVFNLLDEHMRYFHNPKIIVFSVFMLFTLITGFRFLYRNHTNLMRFALLVALMTGVIAMHKSRQYLLLNFPYLVILITLTFKTIKEGKITKYQLGRPSVVHAFLLFLFVVFLLTSSFFNAKLALEKFSPGQNRKLALRYAGGKEKEKEMNVVAPMTFIFNEIVHFHRIQGEQCYLELQKSDPGIYGEGFLKKAESFNIGLLLISKDHQKIFGLSGLETGDTLGDYTVTDKNDQMIILKLLQGK